MVGISFALFCSYYKQETPEMLSIYVIISLASSFSAIITTATTLLALLLPGGLESQAARIFATCLGIVALLFSVLQFIPQIWTTWRLRHIGALSLPTMLIQVPGIWTS